MFVITLLFFCGDGSFFFFFIVFVAILKVGRFLLREVQGIGMEKRTQKWVEQYFPS